MEKYIKWIERINKKKIITAFVNCNEQSLKKKYCDIVNNIYESVFNNKEKWDDALKYVANGFINELKPENFLSIEGSLFLFSKNFKYAQDELLTGIAQLIIGFNKFFKEGNFKFKLIYFFFFFEAICEILSGYID